MISDELKDENRSLAKREAQAEQLKRELQSAYRLKDLAWMAIKSGCDPAYVALRYSFSVEEMQRAREVHEAREAERIARHDSRYVGHHRVVQQARSAEGQGEGETNAGG